MKQLLAVAIGGGLGAMARHLVGLACARERFPMGTLVVNVAGCFLIGLLIAMRAAQAERWDDLTHSALTIGFLGALTTFSTFGLETHQLLGSQQHGLGLLNVASNLLLGLLAVYGGTEVGRWLS